MNQKQSSTNTIERPDMHDESEMHLHGRWLVLARVGWIVVTVTLVILNIIALPDTYVAYFTFTPPVLQDLHRLGLSPTLYGILLTVENAPVQLVYLALGLLLFLRRSDDRMALFCSFMLVTFGNALPLYDFNSGTIVPESGDPCRLACHRPRFICGGRGITRYFLLSLSLRAICATLDALVCIPGGSLLAGSRLLSDAALQCRRTSDVRDPSFSAERSRGAGLSLSAHLHAQGTPADQMGGIWLYPRYSASRCVHTDWLPAATIHQE